MHKVEKSVPPLSVELFCSTELLIDKKFVLGSDFLIYESLSNKSGLHLHICASSSIQFSTVKTLFFSGVFALLYLSILEHVAYLALQLE